MMCRRDANPLRYTLCRQTVTLYHRAEDGTYRVTVRRDACFAGKKTETTEKTGTREQSTFLLVLPGPEVPVAVGDKVIPGVGPECGTREDWAELIPAKVPGLVVVSWVSPQYWHGNIVHTEAGG